jgi:CheY-like chemotaxis protein
MISDQYIYYAYPLLLLLISIFLVYRLRVGRTGEKGPSGLIYAGLILAFLFSVFNLIEHLPGYDDWFLLSVYPYLILLKFVVLAAGLIFIVVGLALHVSYWGERLEDVDSNIKKLHLLEDIQLECHRPYPVPELMDRALNIILSRLSIESGGVYLRGTQQQDFSLIASAGLNDDEVSLMQEYPYGRNIVSESLEKSEIRVTADFRSFGGKAQLALSRFKSLLVVPLVSGRNRLGAILFFATRSGYFSSGFIEIMAPIANYLAEKIEVTRLYGDVKKLKSVTDRKDEHFLSFERKLEILSELSVHIDSIDTFSEKCVTLIDAGDVWLIGLENGRLVCHGGTSAFEGFSDSYRTALISGLDKQRTIVLNQEDKDAEGKNVIVGSSILVSAGGKDAMLFRRKGSLLELNRDDMLVLKMAAAMAGPILRYNSLKNTDSLRRRVHRLLAGILKLKIDEENTEHGLKEFVTDLDRLFDGSVAMFLFRKSGGRFIVSYSNIGDFDSGSLSLSIGEGSTGKVAALRYPIYKFGSEEISANMSQYMEVNRKILNKFVMMRGNPAFQGDFPVSINNRVDYILTVFGYKDSSIKHEELAQLLSIMTGLLSLRIAVDRVKSGPLPEEYVGEEAGPATVVAVAGQAVILDLLVSACQSAGCRVWPAESAGQGLDLFRDKHPQFIIVDLGADGLSEKMDITDLARQGLSELDLVTQVKDISPDTPIIGLTGWDVSPDEARLKQGGIDYILHKPFPMEQLSEIINKIRLQLR